MPKLLCVSGQLTIGRSYVQRGNALRHQVESLAGYRTLADTLVEHDHTEVGSRQRVWKHIIGLEGQHLYVLQAPRVHQAPYVGFAWTTSDDLKENGLIILQPFRDIEQEFDNVRQPDIS